MTNSRTVSGVRPKAAHTHGKLRDLISSGQITQATAMERYGVTGDELDAWQRRYQRFGERGLKQTTLQALRP
jgi:hypothetical protein